MGGLQRVWRLLGTPGLHSQAAVAGIGLRLLLTRRLGVHRRRLAAGEAGCGVRGWETSAPHKGGVQPPIYGAPPHFRGCALVFCRRLLTVGVGGVAGVSQPLEARFSLPHQLLGSQACREGGRQGGERNWGWGDTYLPPLGDIRCFSCSSSSPSRSSACVIQSM